MEDVTQTTDTESTATTAEAAPTISVAGQPSITPDGDSDQLKVTLGDFEGPLDLLLYLIRQEQVNIYDIPVARITDEYLRYLQLMQELDLTVAGDFLVMAAQLIELKSRMLLPRDPLAVEEELTDPRSELGRPPGGVAVPEGHFARFPGGRRDGDAPRPPRHRPQQFTRERHRIRRQMPGHLRRTWRHLRSQQLHRPRNPRHPATTPATARSDRSPSPPRPGRKR